MEYSYRKRNEEGIDKRKVKSEIIYLVLFGLYANKNIRRVTGPQLRVFILI